MPCKLPADQLQSRSSEESMRRRGVYHGESQHVCGRQHQIRSTKKDRCIFLQCEFPEKSSLLGMYEDAIEDYSPRLVTASFTFSAD